MRLLLIEDDPQIVAALQLSLERLDHAVTAVDRDPGSSLAALLDEHDAVILDIGLPGVDGFGVCRRIRTTSDVPIIMLTARSDDIDMVAGLEAGADDYVVKPVSPRVLEARIKATVRRAAPRRPESDDPGSAPASTAPPQAVSAAAMIVGEFTVDQDAVRIALRGRDLALSPTETRLMFAFTDHPGQVLSRDQLLGLAWDHTYLGDSRLVDNAIQRLRAKIAVPGASGRIETVRGFGYRFVP